MLAAGCRCLLLAVLLLLLPALANNSSLPVFIDTAGVVLLTTLLLSWLPPFLWRGSCVLLPPSVASAVLAVVLAVLLY